METSKKSKKKTNKKSKERIGRKIAYSLILLLSANLIVFIFLSFFVYKFLSNGTVASSYHEISVISIPALRSEADIKNTALSYIVYDPITRSIVYSKNPNMRLSPASSIKILTAIVALENYRIEEYLTVPIVASYDESKMGLYLGEEIRVKDLIYGLLLVSGNDAAKTLAYNFPAGYDAFVNEMNQKVKDLHFSDSNVLDPSGYQDNNYSTSFELARLAAYAMENDVIREIVGSKEKIVYGKNRVKAHNLQNLNELLSLNSVTGVKTGFTNEAGGVLITSYIHQGRELIIVVMKSKDRFEDTRNIIDAIKNNVYYSELSSGVDGAVFTAGT